jgi:radical SAM protein with 4Fe4S-binding SPASM domain
MLGTKAKFLFRLLTQNGIEGVRNLFCNAISILVEPEFVSSGPLIIQVEPTINCNLQCKMCFSPFLKRAERDLTLDNFKRILNELPSVRKISLVGTGEPLLNPNLFDIISYAKSKRIDIGFATNATLLNSVVANEILARGIDWLNISLDAATKEAYERIRIRADFNQVLANVREFMDARARFRGKKPEVSVWSLLMKSNIKELPEFISLVHSLGVDRIYVQTIHYWGSREWKNKMLHEEITGQTKEIRKVLKGAFLLCKKNRMHFNYVNVPDIKGERGCKWPWRSCYITTDGYVTPCCMHGSNPTNIHFGNIFKQSFNDIWNNQAYRSFRKAFKSNNMPPVCLDCTSYYKKIKL